MYTKIDDTAVNVRYLGNLMIVTVCLNDIKVYDHEIDVTDITDKDLYCERVCRRICDTICDLKTTQRYELREGFMANSVKSILMDKINDPPSKKV